LKRYKIHEGGVFLSRLYRFALHANEFHCEADQVSRRIWHEVSFRTMSWAETKEQWGISKRSLS